MIEDYVEWLVSLYEERTGISVVDVGPKERAIAILRWHMRRLPGEDDFVSMVATEMAGRLLNVDHDYSCNFFDALSRAADAVRHRILREIRKRMAPRADEAGATEELQSHADPTPESIEIRIERLDLRDQVILNLIFDRKHPKEIADILDISVRTVYRRLKGVINHLNNPAV